MRRLMALVISTAVLLVAAPVAAQDPSAAAPPPGDAWVTGTQLMDDLAADFGYAWIPVQGWMSTEEIVPLNGGINVNPPYDQPARATVWVRVDRPETVVHLARVAKMLASDAADWVLRDAPGAAVRTGDEGSLATLDVTGGTVTYMKESDSSKRYRVDFVPAGGVVATPKPSRAPAARAADPLSVLDTPRDGDRSTITITRYGTAPAIGSVGAPSGGALLAIEVQYEATEDGAFVSPTDWVARVGDGRPADPIAQQVDATNPVVDTLLAATTLKAGETARGWIVFDAPAQGLVTIDYVPSAIGSEPMWQVKVLYSGG